MKKQNADLRYLAYLTAFAKHPVLKQRLMEPIPSDTAEVDAHILLTTHGFCTLSQMSRFQNRNFPELCEWIIQSKYRFADNAIAEATDHKSAMKWSQSSVLLSSASCHVKLAQVESILVSSQYAAAQERGCRVLEKYLQLSDHRELDANNSTVADTGQFDRGIMFKSLSDHARMTEQASRIHALQEIWNDNRLEKFSRFNIRIFSGDVKILSVDSFNAMALMPNEATIKNFAATPNKRIGDIVIPFVEVKLPGMSTTIRVTNPRLIATVLGMTDDFENIVEDMKLVHKLSLV